MTSETTSLTLGKCPKCGSTDLHSAELGGKAAVACSDCDWIAAYVYGDGIKLFAIPHPSGPSVPEDADVNPEAVETIDGPEVLECMCGESYVDVDGMGMCDFCYLIRVNPESDSST